MSPKGWMLVALSVIIAVGAGLAFRWGSVPTGAALTAASLMVPAWARWEGTR